MCVGYTPSVTFCLLLGRWLEEFVRSCRLLFCFESMRYKKQRVQETSSKYLNIIYELCIYLKIRKEASLRLK